MANEISKADVIRLVTAAGKLDEFEAGWGRPLDVYLDEYADTPEIGWCVLSDLQIPRPGASATDVAGAADPNLSRLDAIAREAWHGSYERVGVLSRGERLYVALAAGRMRELAPGDSIAYAVERIGPEWMSHMLTVWRNMPQPKD